MAEILSPGVFIEEVPSQAQVVQPVSTSTMGIVGGAQRGPTDEATLVTSYEQYTRIFGDLIRDSRMPLSMAAYFANGGRRAYVVRVAPADAVSANVALQSAQVDDDVYSSATPLAAMGDAVSGGSTLKTLIEPGSVTLRWRSAGTPVVSEVLRNRGDDADLQGDGVAAAFEGRINPASIPSFDGALPAVDPSATMAIDWTTGAGAGTTITLTTATAGDLVATGTSAGGSATLDLRTGFISIEFDAGEIPDNATDIELSYTPTVDNTVSDDGAGALTGADLTGPGTVDYETGEWAATANNATIQDYAVLAGYDVLAWAADPISVGAWANDMKIQVSGNADYYDLATDTYSRFNVNVLLLNSSTGNFDIVESFEEIIFDDPDSAQYFPDVVNDLSDLLQIVEPSFQDEAPSQLSGIAQTQVIAGGNEDAGAQNITATLAETSITPRTVTITYADAAGVAKTITDDGAGNLTGDVDAAGTNTIDYTSGNINVTTSDPINANSLVTVSYSAAPTATVVDEQFGDTAKELTVGGTVYYEAGEDGTYDAANFSRTEFSVSTLQPDYQGLYALDRVEELLQVCVPDFAGDVQVTRDLLDYADSRALLPSGGDRFVVLAVPQGSSAQEAVNYFRFDLGQSSKFAALYWPWVKVADPLRDNRPTVFPPVAHIAGIYARVDQTRNVGKAPGGTIDGAIRYITGLETETTQGERDLVYPNKINPLISSPQTGNAIWGVRTIAQESEWRYINARRLFMFVERSVYNSTFWIVFESNGPSLWARIKSQLEGFLLGLFNEGLLAGSTPAQAFFVRVDESNNSEASIDAGQVIIDVGIAPNKPAEFVRFRFQQKSLSS